MNIDDEVYDDLSNRHGKILAIADSVLGLSALYLIEYKGWFFTHKYWRRGTWLYKIRCKS